MGFFGLLQQTEELQTCVVKNGYNVDFVEFSCIYPTLSRFYFDFEKGYDPVWVLEWMIQKPWFPIAACVLYGVAILLGQAYFSSRTRWHWRTTLACWNLCLSFFSLMGMLRTAPQLIYNLSTMSLRDNLCMDPQVTYGSGSTGFWVQLFVLSKFPELLDTFFIVIHKKKLIFLHWYHHITVLLYCWHSYVTMSPPGIFFVTMNYAVHASMYFYYFLVATKLRPVWFNPIIITALQISQMVVGVAVTLCSFYHYKKDPSHGPCYIQAQNNTAAFVMYGSYLFLFLQFFIGRYLIHHTKGAKVAPLPSSTKAGNKKKTVATTRKDKTL